MKAQLRPLVAFASILLAPRSALPGCFSTNVTNNRDQP